MHNSKDELGKLLFSGSRHDDSMNNYGQHESILRYEEGQGEF